MGFLIHAELVCAGMIFGGIFDNFPSLKVLITESDGGWVPGFMDWLDTIYDSQLMVERQGLVHYFTSNSKVGVRKLRKRPSQYVRDNFCFTLSSTNEFSFEKLLPFLVNDLNLTGNLAIESDYNHAEGSLDIVRRVRKLSTISENAKEDICGRNAAKLLRIDWRPSEFDHLYA
jgi:predicted TIM-barrel fold metal-dependent hydrolase